MVSHYGARFADAWRGCDMEVVKADWAFELRDFNVPELRRGIESLRTRDWPPMLPEFLKLCRPAIDPEGSYVEAVREYRKRFADGNDEWTRNEIFWAAAAVGYHDLMTHPYQHIRGRWKAALEAAKRDPIPVRLPALPAHSSVPVSAERAGQILAELDARLAAKAAVDKAAFRAPVRKPVDPEYAAALADVEKREAERLASLARKPDDSAVA